MRRRLLHRRSPWLPLRLWLHPFRPKHRYLQRRDSLAGSRACLSASHRLCRPSNRMPALYQKRPKRATVVADAMATASLAKAAARGAMRPVERDADRAVKAGAKVVAGAAVADVEASARAQRSANVLMRKANH